VNPLRTVGTIRASAPDGDLHEAAFAGSCFAFRWQNRLVTAAHGVRGIPEDRVVVDPTGDEAC
jgi:hypothetical protein